MKSLSNRDKATGHFAVAFAVFAGLILLAACEDPHPPKKWTGSGKDCLQWAFRNVPEEFERAMMAANQLYGSPDRGNEDEFNRKAFVLRLLKNFCTVKECSTGEVRDFRKTFWGRTELLYCGDAEQWEAYYICEPDHQETRKLTLPWERYRSVRLCKD